MEINLKRPIFTRCYRPKFSDYEHEYKVLIPASRLSTGYDIYMELEKLPEDVLKHSYISEGDLCVSSSFEENLGNFKKAMEEYNTDLTQYADDAHSYNEKVELLMKAGVLTQEMFGGYIITFSPMYYFNVEQEIEIERTKHERLG